MKKNGSEVVGGWFLHALCATRIKHNSENLGHEAAIWIPKLLNLRSDGFKVCIQVSADLFFMLVT